ncbi:MAG: class B sortase [Clostridiales bacterium]|nr:class B sortase [Clostridiales bacterium]
MVRFWKTLNTIYDDLIIVILVAVLLVVIYSAYDTGYVFKQAADDTYTRFRPDRVNAAGLEGSPITDDMVGWIVIDDTSIDYPIMQGEDNLEYLNLDPAGKFSLSGSIFLDCRNSPDFKDPYSVIYGHHMQYGKMFGALDDFLNEDYLASHTTGKLMVGRNAETTYDLKVIYAVSADAKDEIVFDITSDEEVRRILASKGFTGNDRILGLVTCTDADSTERTILFCYILEN